MLESILNSPEAQTELLSMIAWNGLKAAVILLPALVIIAVGRRAAAAYQHMILCLAMIAIFVLPALSLVFPSWESSLIGRFSPEWASGGTATYVSSLTVANAADLPAPAWALWAAAVWIIGTLLILIRTALGFLATARIVRKARVLNDSKLTVTVSRFCSRLNIHRTVRVVSSSRIATPFTWGIFRPTVILPHDADKWPRRDLHFALLHELAHIRRYDVVWHNIATFVSAIHWVNPLIWIARKRMIIEAEKSCDDHVIADGKSGTVYAQHLLTVLRSLKSDNRAIPVGVCMARRSQMEGRLMSILSDRKRSTGINRSLITGITIITVLLVLPLAGLQLQAADEEKPEIKSDTTKEVFPSPDEKVLVDIYPEMKYQSAPEYPKEAIKAGITGNVWIKALIDKEGTVRKAQVHKTSGNDLLDKAAMAAANKNKFKPARQKDKPVAAWVTYKVTFALEDTDCKDSTKTKKEKPEKG